MEVDPVAFRRLRQELYGFDKELLGKLNSRIKRAVEPVRSEAMGNAGALAGITDDKGRPTSIAKAYLGGRQNVKVKVGGRTATTGQDSVVRLVFENKGAAIAEFAAVGHTPQGQALVDRLSRLGSPGRFAWSAMDAHEAEVLAAVRDEVAKTTEEFSARLAAGSSAGVIR